MNDLIGRLKSCGVIKLDLSETEPLAIRKPLTFNVERGRAWVTVQGETHDWFVASGESFTAPAGKTTVVQADPLCRISFEAHALAPALTVRGLFNRHGQLGTA